MSARAIKIAVMALGGQGGGVLASWLVKAGEDAGFIAQSTSVPGVAQRTGATIYYVELFPLAAAQEKGAAPVLALMPTPGDVDILIAAEMMEAGRALARGLVSRQTTLIASTHRVYAVSEKIALGDGRQNADEIRRAVDEAAGRAIWMDMEQIAAEAEAVISAVMLGALAGSGATPISREGFEGVIRASGRAVDDNLKGFALGYDAAKSAPIGAEISQPTTADAFSGPEGGNSGTPQQQPAALARLPAAAREIAVEGYRRAVDFQDRRYGDLYLERFAAIAALDGGAGGERRNFALTKAVAAKLAVAMAYDDVVRVADLKTRASRMARVRADVRANDGQIVRVYEYMHPRLEEFCDLAPAPIARLLLASKGARGAFDALFGRGRRVETTGVAGFLTLKSLSGLRFMRRGSSRYAVEQSRIERWLELIADAAKADYALALEIAGLQRLIKGYGDTHARGLKNYETILAALDRVRTDPQPAERLRRLRDSALKDEEGRALAAELKRLDATAAAA